MGTNKSGMGASPSVCRDETARLCERSFSHGLTRINTDRKRVERSSSGHRIRAYPRLFFLAAEGTETTESEGTILAGSDG